MKKLYLTTIACLNIAICCCAQPTQTLTNDVQINEWGVRLMLMSFTSLAASSNNVFPSGKELQADEPNFWILHNPSGNRGVLLPNLSNGGCFAIKLTTTNGISIPETKMGSSGRFESGMRDL